MNIQFRNVDGLISQALQERVERKLAKLTFATDSDKSAATAAFDLEKAVGSSKSGQLWQASVTIDSAGNRFYASKLADSPEKAADQALREIRTEVRRAKSRQRTLVRKGNSVFKRLARRFSGG
jgi:ribosome-associated translation inhibitor RaiA